MKILVIEDEEPAARGLIQLIHKVIPDAVILDTLQNVEECIQWFQVNQQPDLAFFDVQLKDGVSFEIFQSVKVKCPIIFCTAYDQYAIEAFKVNSVDYLLKPIEENALIQSISKFHELKESYGRFDQHILQQLQEALKSDKKYKDRFLVKAGKKLYHINRNDIAYIYTEEKIVFVVAHTNQRYQLDHTLESLEDSLPPDKFFRVNRQMIVSIESVNAVQNDYGTYFLHLEPQLDANVSVSKYRLEAFKNWLDGQGVTNPGGEN